MRRLCFFFSFFFLAFDFVLSFAHARPRDSKGICFVRCRLRATLTSFQLPMLSVRYLRSLNRFRFRYFFFLYCHNPFFPNYSFSISLFSFFFYSLSYIDFSSFLFLFHVISVTFYLLLSFCL